MQRGILPQCRKRAKKRSDPHRRHRSSLGPERDVLRKDDVANNRDPVNRSTKFTVQVAPTRSISAHSRKSDKFNEFPLGFVTSRYVLVELRSRRDVSNMPAMFFGDEHLGKAVAMLRESADLNQKQLAHEVGGEPNTMNQYESGRRGMNEEVIFRIARVLQRDPIEIWDMAYAIFRLNHFRGRAGRERHRA